jgi:hypothetical protein
MPRAVKGDRLHLRAERRDVVGNVTHHATWIIRDFFPNGTDFSTISTAEVAKVERLLNARPRKSFGFRTARGLRRPRLLLNFYALAR